MEKETNSSLGDSVYNLPNETNTMYQCMYGINVLFGFPTNFYVFWLIIKGSSSITLEFFNLNLSVCEIVICLNSLSSFLEFYFPELLHLKLVTGFFLGSTITGRPLFQCLICMERYLAVVHPVTFLKYKPLRYRVFLCSLAWTLILGSCLVCMYTTDESHFYIYIHFFSVQFLVYFIIKLFCLVAVLRALKQSGPGERRKEEENNMKRRAFHLILITTVTMSIIYIPLMISGFIFMFTKEFFVDLFSFGFLCFILAGFVQPLLYLHRSAKINFACFINSIQVFQMMRSNYF